MKSHNGMRPQDIVVLLQIITIGEKDWQYRDLAHHLNLSLSEISDSLRRSHLAGLIDESRKKVHRQKFFEFIEHGLAYVFPQQPGSLVTGIPTAHSHPVFEKIFPADIAYVWPHDEGRKRGLSITPLYKGVAGAVKKDELLHLLLAAIDMLRVGRVREKKKAIDVLGKHILHE